MTTVYGCYDYWVAMTTAKTDHTDGGDDGDDGGYSYDNRDHHHPVSDAVPLNLASTRRQGEENMELVDATEMCSGERVNTLIVLYDFEWKKSQSINGE